MTRDDVNKMLSIIKASVPTGNDDDMAIKHTCIEIVGVLISAQLAMTEQMERMANAMVAQTKMLAIAYNMSEDKMDKLNETLEEDGTVREETI